MTPDEIREVFDGFIEYPEGSEKLYVTTASTLIFAHHIAKIAAEREREACAKLCDEIGSDLWIGDADEASVAKCAAAIRARSTT